MGDTRDVDVHLGCGNVERGLVRSDERGAGTRFDLVETRVGTEIVAERPPIPETVAVTGSRVGECPDVVDAGASHILARSRLPTTYPRPRFRR